MSKILITAGTSALAIKLRNKLQSTFDVYLGEEIAAIPSVLTKNYIITPSASSQSYAHSIIKIALDHNIEKILALKVEEVKKLSLSLTLFEEYGITVLTPRPAQLAEVNMLRNPDKGIKLSLVENGLDLFTNNQIEIDINGLLAISDSHEDFALITL